MISSSDDLLTPEQRHVVQCIRYSQPVRLRRNDTGAEYTICKHPDPPGIVGCGLPRLWYDIWDAQGKLLHNGVMINLWQLEMSVLFCTVLEIGECTE